MCSSYKVINIIKQSNISNHELSIFLNNVSKEALTDYLIYSKLPINPNKISKNKMMELIINNRVLTVNNDTDILSIDVNKLKLYYYFKITKSNIVNIFISSDIFL